SCDRDSGGPRRARPTRQCNFRDSPEELQKGRQQRPAEGLLKDGHFDVAELSGRPGVRSHRSQKTLVDKYFTGTASRIEGVGLEVLAREARMKHEHAFAPLTESVTELSVGGDYQYRVRGEYHLLNPQSISKLQQAVREKRFETFQEYTELIDKQNH